MRMKKMNKIEPGKCIITPNDEVDIVFSDDVKRGRIYTWGSMQFNAFYKRDDCQPAEKYAFWRQIYIIQEQSRGNGRLAGCNRFTESAIELLKSAGSSFSAVKLIKF